MISQFRACVLLALATQPGLVWAHDYVIAPSGGDFTTIQAGLDIAVAGDRVVVRDHPNGYRERLVFPRDGDLAGGFIELVADAGHTPRLDASGLSGQWMIELHNRNYIRVRGLELLGNFGQGDGSAIRIHGYGSNIEILDNHIHDLTGDDSMAITVYGTASASISELLIAGNLVHDCTPAHSEAITLNGNVERFVVENNVVRDVNNIGIDFIGGETSIHPSAVARDGICRGNQVYRANSNYGGGYAGGIYVDGGRDILIENNLVVGCDLGIEVGAENVGLVTSGIVVRQNTILLSGKAGLVFGGYDASVGRTRDCLFTNNLCYQNDQTGTFLGELWVQFADDNRIENNIFVSTSQNVLVYSDSQATGNVLNHNLFMCPGGPTQAEFAWGQQSFTGWAAYRAGTGHDADSLFGDPVFLNPIGADGVLGTADDDFRLSPGSPAIDRGDSDAMSLAVMSDAAANPRFADAPLVVDAGQGVAPIIDMGPLEFQAADGGIARYCDAQLNSTGKVTRLTYQGTSSVGAQDLTLIANDGVPGRFCLFFYGPQSIDVPFGDGRRCVGGALWRLPPAQVFSGAGVLQRALDWMTAPIGQGPGQVLAGSTWSFQAWFRDPGGPGGAGFNLSDSLRVSFTP